jgi:hypothetical protein
MMKRSSWLFVLWLAITGCGGSGNGDDAAPDSPGGCDPATVLPVSYRLIAMVSTGAVQVTTSGEVTSGTIDATAGGVNNAADNPYVYVDLRSGTKVAVNDLDARTSTAWDIALKRSSLRTNSGDSGTGGRELAAVQAATLAQVTQAPASGYASDDFATADCMLDSTAIGEPRSAFGDWYDYDVNTHVVTPKAEVYVLKRNNGSRTAFRIKAYYGDPSMPMRGAFYSVEWKQLSQ